MKKIFCTLATVKELVRLVKTKLNEFIKKHPILAKVFICIFKFCMHRLSKSLCENIGMSIGIVIGGAIGPIIGMAIGIILTILINRLIDKAINHLLKRCLYSQEHHNLS